MGQAFEYGQTFPDDLVALAPLDIGDEADAAGIVFVGRVVQPLLLRQSPMIHRKHLVDCRAADSRLLVRYEEPAPSVTRRNMLRRNIALRRTG